MKRALILLVGIFLALCDASFAQQDIVVSGSGPYRTIGNNLRWAGTGPGGFNNNFIFTPTPGTTGTCVVFRNDDPVGHSFTFGALVNADPATVAYTTAPGTWTSVSNVIFAPQGTNVLASATTPVYIRTAGAAKVVLVLSGGSGANTVDIFAIDGQDYAPCTGVQPNTINSGGPSPTLACNSTATVNVAGGATTIIVPAVAGNIIRVCGFMVTVAALSTASDDSFVSGTGAGCAGGLATKWKLGTGSAVGSETQFGGVFGSLFQGAASDQICFVNASPGGSVDVSIMYTQF